MALEPADLVNDIAGRVHDTAPAPVLLSRPVNAAGPLPPARSDPTLSAAHEAWARVHAGQPASGQAGGAGVSSPGGWRGRLGRLVARVTPDGAQRDDRVLIGDLIRAADTLAARCDVLTERVTALEASLAEVVEVLGADLTLLRAELADRRDPATRPTDG